MDIHKAFFHTVIPKKRQSTAFDFHFSTQEERRSAEDIVQTIMLKQVFMHVEELFWQELCNEFHLDERIRTDIKLRCTTRNAFSAIRLDPHMIEYYFGTKERNALLNRLQEKQGQMALIITRKVKQMSDAELAYYSKRYAPLHSFSESHSRKKIIQNEYHLSRYGSLKNSIDWWELYRNYFEFERAKIGKVQRAYFDEVHNWIKKAMSEDDFNESEITTQLELGRSHLAASYPFATSFWETCLSKLKKNNGFDLSDLLAKHWSLKNVIKKYITIIANHLKEIGFDDRVVQFQVHYAQQDIEKRYYELLRE